MADPTNGATSRLEAADAEYQPFPRFDQWNVAIDKEHYNRRRVALAERRTASSQEDWDRAVEIATRSAALETGAIEGLYSVDRGFTFSVATQATAWEMRMDERDSAIRPLFEAHLRAYDLILDAATKTYPITEAYIRRLHEVLTEPQETFRALTPSGWQDQPLPKGEYKSQPNHPWRGDEVAHAYAPVLSTQPEMHRLVNQLASEEFQAAHPVIQAAYAHYGLVAIHPFADGNGRVARAVASIYLYRADSVPLLIYADQVADYIAALEEADANRFQPLTDFVFDRAVGAIARVSEVLRLSTTPPPSSAITRLQQLTYLAPGITHAEFHNALTTLSGLLSSTIEKELKDLGLPSTIVARRVQAGSPVRGELPANYRRPFLGQIPSQGFEITNPAPAKAAVSQHYDLLVSVEGRAPGYLIRQLNSSESLEVSYAEVNPEPSEDLRYRLSTFVRAGLYERLADLTRAAEAQMRKLGLISE